MTDAPRADVLYDVACPHCKKRFRAQLLSGSAARYQGFKCPHDLSGEDEVVHEPEAADHERALARRKPVVRRQAAIDESVDRELPLDPLDGGADAGILPRQEADLRDEERGGVERATAEGLD